VNSAKPNLKDRARKILQGLRKTYPDVKCALDHKNPLQLLIATILSAQCTDERVNKVTPALFKAYRTPKDFAEAPLDELEGFIHSTGFYRNKAKSIKNCCIGIVDRFDGRVPQKMEELVTLDGIGRKTANVVLGVAYGKAEGVVVDTHVGRLSSRMGLTKHKTPEKIEQALMKIIPEEDWINFSHLLIWHGRKRCSARRPDCIRCEIADECPKNGVPMARK